MYKTKNVEIITLESAEKMARADCEYCQEYLRLAKSLKLNLIWDVDSRDIVGITLDGTK